jgi:hypothetical protein
MSRRGRTTVMDLWTGTAWWTKYLMTRWKPDWRPSRKLYTRLQYTCTNFHAYFFQHVLYCRCYKYVYQITKCCQLSYDRLFYSLVTMFWQVYICTACRKVGLIWFSCSAKIHSFAIICSGEKPAETQTSIRLASYLVRAPNRTPDLEDMKSNHQCGGNLVHWLKVVTQMGSHNHISLSCCGTLAAWHVIADSLALKTHLHNACTADSVQYQNGTGGRTVEKPVD